MYVCGEQPMELTIGARITCRQEIAIPTASTGTTAPRIVLQRRGVVKMPAIVVTVVIRTDKATSPLAISTRKL